MNLGQDNSLVGILGALTVMGQAGTNTKLNIDDQGTTSTNTYAVNATQVTRQGGPTITYGTIQTLTLNCSDGDQNTGLGNVINVYATSAGTTTQINAGKRRNTIQVSSGLGQPIPNSLNYILGSLTINAQGDPGSRIIIDDSGSPGPRVYRGNTIVGAGVKLVGTAVLPSPTQEHLGLT